MAHTEYDLILAYAAYWAIAILFAGCLYLYTRRLENLRKRL